MPDCKFIALHRHSLPTCSGFLIPIPLGLSFQTPSSIRPHSRSKTIVCRRSLPRYVVCVVISLSLMSTTTIVIACLRSPVNPSLMSYDQRSPTRMAPGSTVWAAQSAGQQSRTARPIAAMSFTIRSVPYLALAHAFCASVTAEDMQTGRGARDHRRKTSAQVACQEGAPAPCRPALRFSGIIDKLLRVRVAHATLDARLVGSAHPAIDRWGVPECS